MVSLFTGGSGIGIEGLAVMVNDDEDLIRLVDDADDDEDDIEDDKRSFSFFNMLLDDISSLFVIK